MTLANALYDEIDRWFSDYFTAFIDIGAGVSNASKILLYWGVPLHTSSPRHATWLTSSQEVVDALRDMQRVLKEMNYTHTEALDKSISVYHQRAARVETIMSRRRSDSAEIDRAAVSFELRKTGQDWIIISTTICPTHATTLHEIW